MVPLREVKFMLIDEGGSEMDEGAIGASSLMEGGAGGPKGQEERGSRGLISQLLPTISFSDKKAEKLGNLSEDT